MKLKSTTFCENLLVYQKRDGDTHCHSAVIYFFFTEEILSKKI